MRTINALLAVCGTLFAVMPVYAGSASATVSDIRIELIDLDLDDGISPSLTFAGRGEPFDIAHWVSAVAGDQSVLREGYSPFETNGATVSTDVNFGSASVSGDGTAAGSTISTSGYAFSRRPPFEGYSVGFGGSVLLREQPYYTLSANTRVVLSAVVDLVTEAVPKWVGHEDIGANAGIWLGGYMENGWEERRYRLLLVPRAGESLSISDEYVEVSLSNFSDSSTDMGLSVYANSWGFGTVFAVPESDAYLLMLAGLALTACVGRKRGRSHVSHATLRSCAAAERASAAAS